MPVTRTKRGRTYRTGVTFAGYMEKTLSVSRIIRKINAMDNQFTPYQQSQIIRKLPGLTGTQLQRMEKQTGPKLADSIRKVISRHRANNNRSQKDKYRKR